MASHHISNPNLNCFLAEWDMSTVEVGVAICMTWYVANPSIMETSPDPCFATDHKLVIFLGICLFESDCCMLVSRANVLNL